MAGNVIYRNNMLSIYNKINSSHFDIEELKQPERRVLKIILKALKEHKNFIEMKASSFQKLQQALEGESPSISKKGTILEGARKIFGQVDSESLKQELVETGEEIRGEIKTSLEREIAIEFYPRIDHLCIALNAVGSRQESQRLLQKEVNFIDDKILILKQDEKVHKSQIDFLDSIKKPLDAILKKVNSIEEDKLTTSLATIKNANQGRKSHYRF